MNTYDEAFQESTRDLIQGLDAFTKQYLETALWSSNDESTESGGYPLDKNYDIFDIHPDSLRTAIKDCKAFQEANDDDIYSWEGLHFIDPHDPRNRDCHENAGHNFWLTRNHHGAGFWDDDGYSAEVQKRLTDASHRYGEAYVIVGDDGMLHIA